MQFTHAPMPLNVSGNFDQQFNWFFGHYDLRIYVSDTAYIDVGRGSVQAMQNLDSVETMHTGLLGTIGQFCEFAPTSKLMCGGEHRNHEPINIVFADIKPFRPVIQKDGIERLGLLGPKPFTIGHNVILSADALVLPGASIGDGTVIGARGLVAKEIEPFAIAGGNPARTIKPRFDDETRERIQAVRWWDFDLVYKGNNLHRLQELALDTETQHVYRKPQPRFVFHFSAAEKKASILGFLDGAQMRPMTDAPPHVQRYVAQIRGQGPYEWIADVWNL